MQYNRVNKRMIAIMLIVFFFTSAFSMLGVYISFADNMVAMQNAISEFGLRVLLLSYPIYTFEFEVINSNSFTARQQTFIKQVSPMQRSNPERLLFAHNLQSLGNSKIIYYFILPQRINASHIFKTIISFMHDKDGKKDDGTFLYT